MLICYHIPMNLSFLFSWHSAREFDLSSDGLLSHSLSLYRPRSGLKCDIDGGASLWLGSGLWCRRWRWGKCQTAQSECPSEKGERITLQKKIRWFSYRALDFILYVLFNSLLPTEAQNVLFQGQHQRRTRILQHSSLWCRRGDKETRRACLSHICGRQ